MKLVQQILAISVGVAICFFSYMANSTDLRIGILNREIIFRDSLFIKEAQKQLEQEFQGKKKELADKEKEINSKIEIFQRDKDILPEKDRSQKESELNKLNVDLKNLANKYHTEVGKKQEQKLLELDKIMSVVLKEVATKEKLDLIMPADFVLYHGNHIDYTNHILKALDEKFKKNN